MSHIWIHLQKLYKFEGQTWNISIEKAQKYMNYVPKYNLEQMIKYYGKGMKDELSRFNRE